MIRAKVVTEQGPAAGWPVVRLYGEPEHIASFLHHAGFEWEATATAAAGARAVEIDWADEREGVSTEVSVHEAIETWKANQ